MYLTPAGALKSPYLKRSALVYSKGTIPMLGLLRRSKWRLTAHQEWERTLRRRLSFLGWTKTEIKNVVIARGVFDMGLDPVATADQIDLAKKLP